MNIAVARPRTYPLSSQRNTTGNTAGEEAVDMMQVFNFRQRPRRPLKLEQRPECTQY